MGHGTGREVMKRIAAPMIGGMVTALVLTSAGAARRHYHSRRSRTLKTLEHTTSQTDTPDCTLINRTTQTRKPS